jgi:Domain of unknown function (DUF4386)
MNSTRKAARVAGLLYLVTCIPAPFSLLYVPGKLIVPGNATATAANILASESMFRLSIAGQLINAIAFLFAVRALYRLLQGVDRRQASLMVTLFAISIPISCLNVLNDIAALILVRGADYLSVFSEPQRNALAMVFLRVHSQGLLVAQIFWGLWLFPFGLLVMRSGFIPRILGVLLIAAGFGYLVNSLTLLLLPNDGQVVGQVALILEATGETAIIAWLLIKGARVQESVAIAA